MKTRLLCLLLCLVTMLSLVLTSCSTKDSEEAEEDISNEASESAITLSMWVVSEKEVSAKDAAAVSNALNLITKAKFKTQLVLNFYTEDEYRTKLETAITAYEESRKNQGVIEQETEAESGTGEQEPVTDEMETDDLGLSIIKYPELLQNQVDIVYISGEDMYIDFVEKGWLAELDSELSTASKKIKEYVSGTLLSAAKADGTTYAIPNNRVIGEYTYMLLNKDLVKKYSQQGYVEHNMIDGLFNEYLYTFLNMVYEFGGNEIPIDGNYEDCLDLLAHYWSIDPESYAKLDAFSVFGAHYKNIEELSRGSVILGYTSLFEDETFANAYLQLNKFKFGTDATRGSYFGTSSKENPAAVKFISGTSTILSYNETEEEYEYVDENGVAYYPVVVKYPTATTADIYDNMFGVCNLSRSVSRSMDIVTYLNTNADFRNILQYGVDRATIDKNAIDPVYHYEVKEDGKGNEYAKRLNENYMMKLDATGNMFMAYPEEHMSPDIWESGKVQNRDSLVDPMLGLDFAGFSATTGEEEETITVPANPGYVVTYSGGYSKTAFSENETIKAWLESCDAAGKGIYVLPTEVIDGQNRTIRYYVYNTNVKKAVNFTVDVLREMTEVTNDKGKTEKVQTNLDFTFTYTDVKGGAAVSYDLSVVDLYTKKTNEFEILAKVNDEAATMTVADAKALIKFDAYNTNKYTVEVYDDVSRHTFNKNATISKWILDCDAKNSKNPTPFTLVHSEEKGDKLIYTVILYRDKQKEITDTTVIPTGDGNKLNVQFNLVSTGDTPAQKAVDYALTYVRVVADKSMELSYSIICDGKVETVAEGNEETKDPESTQPFDPNFIILGNLDTELVKYLGQLSNDAVAALNACTTYAEMQTTVAFLQDLLVTIGGIDLSKWDTVAATPISEWDDAAWTANNADPIKALYTKYVKNGDLTTLATYLAAAVATETKPELDLDTGEPVESYGEGLVYFDSPNTIYYKWLTESGYMPK